MYAAYTGPDGNLVFARYSSQVGWENETVTVAAALFPDLVWQGTPYLAYYQPGDHSLWVTWRSSGWPRVQVQPPGGLPADIQALSLQVREGRAHLAVSCCARR